MVAGQSEYVNRIGFSVPEGQPGTDEHWTYMQFDLASLMNKTIVSAEVNFYIFDTRRESASFNLWRVVQPWTAGTLSYPVHHGVSPGDGKVAVGVRTRNKTYVDVTDWVDKWTRSIWNNHGFVMNTGGADDDYIRMAAEESRVDDPSNAPLLRVEFNDTPPPPPPVPPTAPVLLDPADKKVVTTLTPRVAVEPSSDPNPGDVVHYWYRVATGADGATGRVYNSGWVTATEWRVPPGYLQDGVTYSWTVIASDRTAAPDVPSAQVRKFKVNLRLGDQKTSAYDDVGPVRANLATGNVSLRVGSRRLESLGGPLGVSFAYNSQAPPVAGLTASYYADPGLADRTLVRRETMPTHNWGSGSPGPGVPADYFSTRWTGYVTVPFQESNWSFRAAVDSDDPTPPPNKVEVWVNDELAFQYGGAGRVYNLAKNQAVKIEVRYREAVGDAFLELQVNGPVNGPVPASWLSPTPAALPAGWSLSADGGVELLYSEAVVGDQALVLSEPSGVAHEYFRVGSPTGPAGDAGWQPAEEGDAFVSTQVVPRPGGGLQTEIHVQGEDGLTYVFDQFGKLTSVTSSLDDLTPAGAVYTWNGSGRLERMSDPLSGRAVRLTYAGDARDGACPTSDRAGATFAYPRPGMLCQASYRLVQGASDVELFATRLLYNGNGQLARIEDVGDAATGDSVHEFVYGAQPCDPTRTAAQAPCGVYHAPMIQILSPLAFEARRLGQRPDGPGLWTRIGYDTTGGTGRVTGVTLPEPVPGAGLSTHAFSYGQPGPFDTRVMVSGMAMPNGYARAVSHDGEGRILSDANATTATGFYRWDDKGGDRMVSSTDGTMLRTTFHYDQADRPVATYGPAPHVNFDGNGYPTGQAPYQRTVYDRLDRPDVSGRPHVAKDMRGLAAAYWPTRDMAGPAKVHATETGDGYLLAHNWGTAGPAGLGVSENWSARFTGEIKLRVDGVYTFQIYADDGVRLFIDDTPVIVAWNDDNGNTVRQGTFTAPAGRSSPWHRVRLDYYNRAGAGRFQVSWASPVGGDGSGLMPIRYLTPRYGLVTLAQDPDFKQVATEYEEPERGLATATIIDPTGLALRTETQFEAAGAGYARRQAATPPKRQGDLGAPTTTSFAYYAPGVTTFAANPCLSAPVPQGGMLRERRGPDPESVGGVDDAAMVEEFVYDRAGRVVAGRASNDPANNPWSCTAYDRLGRVRTSTARDGAVTEITYTGTKTVTRFLTTGKQTTHDVDLLGRTVAYTDEQGTTTDYAYDQAGRLDSKTRRFAGETMGTKVIGVAYNTENRVGRLTEFPNGAARPTDYSYDRAGRLTVVDRPNNVDTTQIWDDKRGYLESVTHRNGTTPVTPAWSYTRSAAGRVGSETTGARTRAFTYDGAARLWRVTEGATTRTYNYDPNTNRCSTTGTGPSDCAARTSTFDAADRIRSSARAASYRFDDFGNMVEAVAAASGPSYTVKYDAYDHAVEVEDVNEKVAETLSPSGRVLRRVVTTKATGAVADTLYGYEGPGDSPAYERSTGAAPPPPLTDTWTAADGTAWDPTRWSTSTNGSGRTTDVNANRGRMALTANTSARATARPATSSADADVTMTYEFDSRVTGSELRIALRGSGNPAATDAVTSAYRLDIPSASSSSIKIRKVTGGTASQVDTFTYTPDPLKPKQKVRAELVGGRLRIKLWAADSPEPAGWTRTYTDPTPITGAGILQIAHSYTAAARTLYLDDLTLTNPAAGPTTITKTFIAGPDGLHVIDTNGLPTYPLGNGHDDIIGTTNINGTFTANPTTDEFGQGLTPGERLGWLGQHQRPLTHAATGLIRMGVRLYDPTLGRFTSTDPIEGGSCNDYDYTCGDPVNLFDLGGECLGGGKNPRVPQACDGGYGVRMGGGRGASVRRPGPGTPHIADLGPRIPGRPFTGRNAPRKAFEHLENFHGLDPHIASNRLHLLKRQGRLGATDDVGIGRTGDVYNARTGERLGSLTDRNLGRTR